MDLVWAVLLCLAMLDRQARPLAALTACVWALNYASCFGGLYRVPVAVDVFSGYLSTFMVSFMPTARLRWFCAAIVIAPLVHAWHWMLWDAGNANDAVRFAYYTLLALLFSVKVLSLSWPGVLGVVGTVSDLLIRAGRGLLDRLAPVPRSRPRPFR